ncbi:hypothetical protein Psuf_062340 [Phytohabitans suffuscus]|uniref:Transposase (putative) YhgA-like domain-containing protein n=1 Tax=Phytohabitans suffuscus TaxID=624315 RepID=A0A6F8YSV7_9ACTN|nr:hypothetical protein Psuf_062340 [Phytohabitans suffuscus]
MALTKQDRDLVAFLLMKVFDMKIPVYAHAHPHATDVRVLVPRTYHADGVLVYYDAAEKPVFAAVMEVQRGWDPTKRRTWQLYVAQLEAELNVDTALLVYCPDSKLARRYLELFDSGGMSLSLRPFIFTPDDVPLVVDVDEAREHPSLAVLSAICHGDHADLDTAFPALMEAMRAVTPDQAVLYYDIVLAGLPVAARTRWEAFMTTTVGYEYRSELLRNLAAQHEELGEVRGEARGEARAVLTLLKARGLVVPDEIREEIIACTDLAQLDSWLLRAATAAHIDDVMRR